MDFNVPIVNNDITMMDIDAPLSIDDYEIGQFFRFDNKLNPVVCDWNDKRVRGRIHTVTIGPNCETVIRAVMYPKP